MSPTLRDLILLISPYSGILFYFVLFFCLFVFQWSIGLFLKWSISGGNDPRLVCHLQYFISISIALKNVLMNNQIIINHTEGLGLQKFLPIPCISLGHYRLNCFE